jgi:aminoglycoside phosphotransferase (APT) family kinase protein
MAKLSHLAVAERRPAQQRPTAATGHHEIAHRHPQRKQPADSETLSSMERVRGISERLAEVLGEPLAGELRRLSSGASRETFAFATPSHGELIAQIDPPGTLHDERPPQAPLLEAAARAGVPVARVVARGSEDPVLGRSWTVLEALAGTTDPKQILAADGVPQAAELIDSIGAALAAIHRMPADPALAPAVDDPLAQVRAWHDGLGEPHPTFELAFRALEAERPAAARRALVHGDFRMGNLMVGTDGVSGVLDWELAHLGDPLEDLGWLCVPAWRFDRPDRPAGGLGTREQLAAAYERHSGLQVDMTALGWWELAGTLRWGVICVMQAFSHLSGARRSIEHAVIGRRACEVEWDLLEQLDPRPPARAPAQQHAATPAGAAASTETASQPARPRLHDRPTALELTRAARGALGDEVLPGLEGRAEFQVRVTLRALGMVERELERAADHAAVHAAALESLGVADESELAGAIREGRLDGREPEVLTALRATVRAKLEVANPRYLLAGANARATAQTTKEET